jgi:uncharacterized lipoprotein YajG
MVCLVVACLLLGGCAGSGTAPQIDPQKACLRAQKILDQARVTVQSFRDMGEMSSDDYRTAVIAEIAAEAAVGIVCDGVVTQ